MAHRKDSLVIRKRVEDRTQVQKEMFLHSLEMLLNVSVACKVTGLTRSLVYAWRKDDSDFAEKWDHAIEYAEGALESAAYLKLAKELTSARALSMPTARLVEFYLAGAMPDKYKQRGVTTEVNVNQLNISIDWSKIPDDMLARYNAGEITLQDVYEYWTLQNHQSERSDQSAD